MLLCFVFLLVNSNFYGCSTNSDGSNKVPVIHSIVPDSGKAGAIISIKGDNFSSNRKSIDILLDKKKFHPESASSTQLKFSIPISIESGVYQLGISINGQKAISDQKLKILNRQYSKKVLQYNYSVGTQTFSPAYGFSKQDRLIETAEAILDMGSNIIKLALNADQYSGVSGHYASYNALVRNDRSFKKVLDMPFTYYFFWTPHYKWKHGDEYTAEERKADSTAIGDFTEYLLTNYNNSGKRFYLGHWEGDWQLLDGYDPNAKVPEKRIQAMIQWYNTRQNAINHAIEKTPHQDVEVYGYAEVNRVWDAMEGKKRVTNEVLPHSNVDFVSYSAYDSQQRSSGEFHEALSYIEKHLPPKPNIDGKRVFIGEFGVPAEQTNFSPDKHERANRQIIQKAISWGSPFVLYWEIYNNEVDNNGNQRGFWLIDDKGEKWPLYKTHANFYGKAKAWVAKNYKESGDLPTRNEYLNWAYKTFDKPLY